MNLLPPYEAYSYRHLVSAKENLSSSLKKRLPPHISRHLAIELVKLNKEIERRKTIGD